MDRSHQRLAIGSRASQSMAFDRALTLVLPAANIHTALVDLHVCRAHSFVPHKIVSGHRERVCL